MQASFIRGTSDAFNVGTMVVARAINPDRFRALLV
jgi:hypothetical protein